MHLIIAIILCGSARVVSKMMTLCEVVVMAMKRSPTLLSIVRIRSLSLSDRAVWNWNLNESQKDVLRRMI